MGGPKALLPLGESTFLSRACHLFARPEIASVVAVLGAEAEWVRRAAGIPTEATIAVNDRWRESMLWLAGEGGVTRFAEAGAGKVLSGMAKRIAPDAETATLNGPADLEAFAASL